MGNKSTRKKSQFELTDESVIVQFGYEHHAQKAHDYYNQKISSLDSIIYREDNYDNVEKNKKSSILIINNSSLRDVYSICIEFGPIVRISKFSDFNNLIPKEIIPPNTTFRYKSGKLNIILYNIFKWLPDDDMFNFSYTCVSIANMGESIVENPIFWKEKLETLYKKKLKDNANIRWSLACGLYGKYSPIEGAGIFITNYDLFCLGIELGANVHTPRQEFIYQSSKGQLIKIIQTDKIEDVDPYLDCYTDFIQCAVKRNSPQVLELLLDHQEVSYGLIKRIVIDTMKNSDLGIDCINLVIRKYSSLLTSEQQNELCLIIIEANIIGSDYYDQGPKCDLICDRLGFDLSTDLLIHQKNRPWMIIRLLENEQILSRVTEEVFIKLINESSPLVSSILIRKCKPQLKCVDNITINLRNINISLVEYITPLLVNNLSICNAKYTDWNPYMDDMTIDPIQLLTIDPIMREGIRIEFMSLLYKFWLSKDPKPE